MRSVLDNLFMDWNICLCAEIFICVLHIRATVRFSTCLSCLLSGLAENEAIWRREFLDTQQDTVKTSREKVKYELNPNPNLIKPLKYSSEVNMIILRLWKQICRSLCGGFETWALLGNGKCITAGAKYNKQNVSQGVLELPLWQSKNSMRSYSELYKHFGRVRMHYRAVKVLREDQRVYIYST